MSLFKKRSEYINTIKSNIIHSARRSGSFVGGEGEGGLLLLLSFGAVCKL